MNGHLTDEQLKFWTDDRNRGNPLVRRIGNHILECKECRDRASLPAEQFRATKETVQDFRALENQVVNSNFFTLK